MFSFPAEFAKHFLKNADWNLMTTESVSLSLH